MKLALELIRELAGKQKACNAQFVPFCQAIDNGNELLAWQIVLGNKNWLTANHVPIPSNVAALANYIGISLYPNGKIKTKISYDTDGNMTLIEDFYKNGVMQSRYMYKCGRIHGICEIWNETGELLAKYWEVNGESQLLYKK